MRAPIPIGAGRHGAAWCRTGWHQAGWHPAGWHQAGWHQAGWHQAGWHHGYGPAFGYHHGFGGGGSWIGHMVVSSIVHGLVYGAIFRLLRHLSLGEIVLLAVLVIGGLWLWNRDRGYRRW